PQFERRYADGVRDTRFDPLPSELRRRREQAAEELQTGIKWVDGCPAAAGAEVLVAMEALTNAPNRVLALADQRLGGTRRTEWVSAARLRGDGTDEERLDALAAVVAAFIWLSERDDQPV